MTSRGRRAAASAAPALVHFDREETFRERVHTAWEREARRLHALVPGVDLQHVGSTAVPGTLTKGDLDIQVRVPPGAFAVAEAALARLRSQRRERRRPRSARELRREVPGRGHRHQLTSVSGPFDTFWRFRDALLARADLRERYDALKRSFEGRPMAEYRRAKKAFFEEREIVEIAGDRRVTASPGARGAVLS